MTKYFLTILNGIRTVVSAITASTGVADAEKIVATSSTGKIDQSLLPPMSLDHEFREVTSNFVISADAPSLQYIDALKFGILGILPEKVDADGRIFCFRNVGAKPFTMTDQETALEVEPCGVLWLHCNNGKWTEVA